MIGLGAAGALALAPASAPAAGAVGQVLTTGAAADHGAADGRPVVGIARSSSGGGYWLAASDGGVYSYGDAPFRGSAAEKPLAQPVVDIAGSPTGQGYWLAARDGGVLSFGDALFSGSVGGIRLNAPVVGMAATPTGKGYWLASSDGGVFAFGDATYAGSAGGTPLNAPIAAIAATPSGRGYWMLARDGGVFAFGDATYAGSTAGRVGGTAVDLAGAPDGKGYWVASAGGAVSAFGSAPAHAAVPAPPAPVSGIEATPSGDGLWLATGGRLLGDFGVTCYALQGTTASGAPVAPDVVAVDPRTVPLGSEIFVAGVGVRRALDTGGAIKGRRLDIWNPSADFCRDFGHQRLPAYVMA